MVDFIGLGAQKAGTSWVYACLYEHPEICAPIKEIHFFSRPQFSQGKDWYESHFKRCDKGKKRGEFSTSYLYSVDAPERIHWLYPNVKLIAILRNPTERAYSQYRNAIKAGEIPEIMSFDEYQKSEPSCLEQGLYAEQLERYYNYFPKEQILVLIYEDSKKNPEKFIRSIYEFLGVNPDFKPTMLRHMINVARTLKRVFLEKWMHKTAEFLRRTGFDKLVWFVRKSGLPDFVRTMNTKQEGKTDQNIQVEIHKGTFIADTQKLSTMINRDMVQEWKIRV